MNHKMTNMVECQRMHTGAHIWQLLGCDRTKSCSQDGNTACYRNPSQLPMATAVMNY